jgi:hypothetical protein
MCNLADSLRLQVHTGWEQVTYLSRTILVELFAQGAARCENRLPQDRPSLASILMAGSNSAFNAPLE